MTVIPTFLLKKLYVTGSLRLLPEGVAFDFLNTLGPGVITRINSIRLDGIEYLAHQIWLKVQDQLIRASEVSDSAPLTVFLNEPLTCILDQAQATAGAHTITLDLLSREAGKVVVSIQDKLP